MYPSGHRACSILLRSANIPSLAQWAFTVRAASRHVAITPQHDLPCPRHASRSGSRHPATAVATSSPHPTVRASKHPVPHRSSGSPAWPWDGSARLPRLIGFGPQLPVYGISLASRREWAWDHSQNQVHIDQHFLEVRLRKRPKQEWPQRTPRKKPQAFARCGSPGNLKIYCL